MTPWASLRREVPRQRAGRRPSRRDRRDGDDAHPLVVEPEGEVLEVAAVVCRELLAPPVVELPAL